MRGAVVTQPRAKGKERSAESRGVSPRSRRAKSRKLAVAKPQAAAKRRFRSLIPHPSSFILPLFALCSLLPVVGSTAEPTRPEDIRQTNPGFLVRADVDRATRSYREGDTLSVTVSSEADAYLYVLYKQADGKVFQIFPNSVQTSNQVKARQAVQIPATDDLFRWVVGEPFGKEVIKVIASKQPLDELSDPAMRAKFFNPVSAKNLKGIELELGKKEKDKEIAWAEDTCEITTYAASNEPDQVGTRRFAAFIGIGDYAHLHQFVEVAAKDGTKESIHVGFPGHRDARILSGVLREVGQLNDMRVITNDLATRRAIEEAITRWLPSVSRPGDTVIISFSGVALPVPRGPSSPAPGSSADSLGAVLACHEHMLLPYVREIAKKLSDGKGTRGEAEEMQAAIKAIGDAKSPEQMAVALAVGLGISDDLFVHWLQALAGRRILVVLDTPYAGVFAPKAAGSSAGTPAGMGGMAGGVSRLKTLGQQEIAVLGACTADQGSISRDPQGLSLMTSCLIQAIQDAPGTLNLDQAYPEIEKRMAAKFEQINAQRRAAGDQPLTGRRPFLVNSCTRPVMLKP